MEVFLFGISTLIDYFKTKRTEALSAVFNYNTLTSIISQQKANKRQKKSLNIKMNEIF